MVEKIIYAYINLFGPTIPYFSFTLFHINLYQASLPQDLKCHGFFQN